jgi:hypothetical protein
VLLENISEDEHGRDGSIAVIDEHGYGDFQIRGRGVAVWINEEAEDRGRVEIATW